MILNEEQLRRKARELALTHTLSGGGLRASSALIRGFDRDASELREYALRLQREGQGGTRPAEEWLLDHADFIAAQILHIRKMIRPGETRRLPALSGSRELRVLALCADYLEHTDGLFDADLLAAYAEAYQEIAVLTIAEVAMMPLFVRIAVIRRLAGLCRTLKDRREAGDRIDRILKPFTEAEKAPSAAAIREALDGAGETLPLSGPTIVHLVDRLGEMAEYAGDVREWLVCRLDAQQESLEKIIAHEHGLQASYEVSASHAIQSLRRLDRLDWSGMFERLCHVDRVLRTEAAGTYPLLDASSRHVLLGRVRELAGRMRVPETLVAKQAVELAARYGEDKRPDSADRERRGRSGGPAECADGEVLPRPAYAAYYLLDPRGVRALWRALKLCAKPRAMPRAAVKQMRLPVYFAALAGVFAVLWAVAVRLAAPAFGASDGQALLAAATALLLAFPASEWAVQFVHQSICAYCRSRPLLRYDYSPGIPDDAATMVVVPVIWTSPSQVRESAERLELHYLANRDPNLHFALLGDFADADEETKEEDQAIADEAIRAIEALNRAYGTEGGSTFHVYIRRRTWNEADKVWMGWERKRGKLVEFADLLRGGTDTSYAVRVGDPSVLPRIRYLITLDADTQLPIGTAQRMIGTMHYPYNRPRLNEEGTRVTEGYGVLQPRIGVSHESAMRSRFARLWSGEPGIDPYAFAMSDPYQDGLDVGIFTGKGILDVDTFRAVLRERIPDNRVLSHDLLEGGFLRSGLLPDIELVDGHPATFSAWQHRQHRWIRGDWQLVGWLRRSAADRSGRKRRVDLSPLTRWQIVDNLRRSLLPPALLVLIGLAMLLPAGYGAAAASIALATLAMPVWRALAAPDRLVRRPAVLAVAAGQSLWALATLPYQAVMTIDAIARALYRIAISRRKLLEWVSSAEVERIGPRRLMGLGRGLALAVAAGILALSAASPAQTAIGVLLAVIWASAPVVIDWLDKSAPAGEIGLTEEEKSELRKLAADIWRFYEEFTTERDNWLPPDNVQIDPPIGVARRTSPTNIGMLVVCTVTARDFGFIDTPGMIERLERTIGTIERMEKWHGHLYNWYNTETLRPLPPQYVSTVDSGNLLGCLIAAKEGLAEWLRRDFPEGGSADGDGRSAASGFGAPEGTGTGRLRPVTAGMEASADIGAQTEPGAPADAGMEASADIGAQTKSGAPADAGMEASAEPLGAYKPAGASAGSGDWAARGRRLIERMEALIAGTDFRPLYDPASKLFSLGFHTTTGEKETILYDLLASEARQASFIAIALGQVPVSHWFKLGRAMTRAGGGKALVSWSGTMFEYLMPPLLMRTYAGTVWDATYRAVIRKQAEYARLRGVPMGISESGYYAFDFQMNYQYRAFGVPGLGFKRGLETDLVVAPYATVMVLPYEPRLAMDELRKMEALGARGEYGYYEAIDCTRERLPEGKTSVVIRSFMAHHQGMMMLTLGNVLLGRSMVDRFHADKRIRSADLLLQERVPERPALVLHAAAAPLRMQDPDQRLKAPQRTFRTPHPPQPEVCVLSNGSFTTVVTASGTGFMHSDGLAVTRWREDACDDCWGGGVYIRDVEREAVWSAAWHPAGSAGDEYAAEFSLEQARFMRRDGDIRTTTDICVAAEGNAEIRRITIANRGETARLLEVTTCVELALAEPAADAAHPAFSKLFIETSFDEEQEALLARRRPRSPDDRPVWAVHGLVPCGEAVGPIEYETDRARFIGRGGSLREPQATRARLAGTVGAVVDPIFAVRRRFTVPPGGQVKLIVVTGTAASREEALELYGRFSTAQQVERAFQLAWTRSRIELHHLHMQTVEASLCHVLAGRVLYAPPLQAERAEALDRGTYGQSGLWPLGISGDLPIVLVRAYDTAGTGTAAELIRCHEWLRRAGILFDLVFLIESPGGYQQELRDRIRRLIEQSVPRMYDHRPGSAYALSADQLKEEEKRQLAASARIILRLDGSSLRAQLRVVSAVGKTAVPAFASAAPAEAEAADADAGLADEAREGLMLWNGWGGFVPDGSEYRIVLPEGKSLPAPWSNVAANPDFGFLITERGTGYTWFRNSREFKLTPWSNDPVLDPAGEACYIRDEETGRFWSVAPAPAGGPGTAVVSHGRGYTRFERRCSGIRQTMTVFAARRDPVKITEIRLVNTGNRRRRLSVTGYVSWVLGVSRENGASSIGTEWDGRALYARNAWQETFRTETAFLGIVADDGGVTGPAVCTADRREFVGRGGSLAEPAAMRRRSLSGSAGRFADSCGAVQLVIELEPGAERTVCLLLGCGRDGEEARALASAYGNVARCREAFGEVGEFWAETLGQLRVETPDPAMDMLLNGWLLYQTLSCRMWARSAFYQSGGAYGFRDQLQDSLALLHSRPDLTRRQILIHAARQYREGDVQHWWHEETKRGVRTRYSDDLLWLPYAAARYVLHTGDTSLLGETRPFLVSEELGEDEHERYEPIVESDEHGTVYEHCLRAIGRALRLGGHGLPLMGIGDWNDGMNRVGSEGRGESVWLGWFLMTVLDLFARVCDMRGDGARAADLRRARESLAEALNRHAWDGEWYRRAYTDGGEWLGTSGGRECRIDAIAQSWSVISGGAPPERALRAMQSFDRELVDRAISVARLLTPPFDTTEPSPGYIQGYPPGIRENGGQYTHGVIWSIVAWSILGDGDKAFELFDMLNPIRHTASPREIAVYLGEPYAMAADVYMSNPYRGRAGWTWYTGAAGWMYQAGVEWILGIRREGGRLLLKPRIPAGWPGFKAEYRFGGSVYAIEVIGRQAGRNGPGLTVDGKPVPAEAGRAGDGGGGPAKAGRADGGPAAGAPKPAAANGGAAAGRDAASAGSAAVRTDAVGSAVAQPPDFAGSDYSRGAVAPVNAPAGWYVDLVDDGARHEVVLQL
jgi:cellobiose phosphorylase